MVEYKLYPVYFDSTKTRSEGRKVSTENAVNSPTLEEIAEAVKQIGYNATIEREVSYPRNPHQTKGRVLVQASDTNKNDLVQATAAYIQVLRMD